MSKSLHITRALVYDGYEALNQRDLYIKDGRVVPDKPHDAVTINLEGHTIFPAFINAHDHLELNHYPRTKFRDVYDNAHQWGEDVNARLHDEPFKSLRAYPLWDKVFIGGMKNLLCGATTVIHHGAPHKPMFRKDFPVRVLRQYGWAHSLHFNTEEEIIKSYQSTPKDVPWFIHLAEGTDAIAQGEYQKLKKMGCLGVNTVPVHCVGLTREDVYDTHHIAGEYSASHGSQMPWVWCPTTNIYLLGKTGHPRMGWNTLYRLGSDSRLTATGDLLDEVNYMVSEHRHNPEIAYLIATTRTYRYQKKLEYAVQPKRDEDVAEFIIVDTVESPLERLVTSQRKDLAMVMRDGVPRVGNADLMTKFNVQTVGCTVDGVEKRIHIDLAKQVHRCTLKEKGLEVDDLPMGKRFFLF